MNEENKEEIMDNPLVVHKSTDASYQEMASDVEMSSTHIEEDSPDTPTLERHRFKKDKNNNKVVWILLVILVIIAVICGAYFSGAFGNSDDESTTTTRKQYVTQAQNDFSGIITVKGTYIFFEGVEVDGISGLEKEIKYLDAGTTFTIQDENADSTFLNDEVLYLLSQYEMNYDITHIVSSGLISQYETTTQTTTEKETEKSTSESKNEQKKQSDE